MSPQKISQHLWPHNMLGMLDPSSVTSCLGAKKNNWKIPLSHHRQWTTTRIAGPLPVPWATRAIFCFFRSPWDRRYGPWSNEYLWFADVQRVNQVPQKWWSTRCLIPMDFWNENISLKPSTSINQCQAMFRAQSQPCHPYTKTWGNGRNALAIAGGLGRLPGVRPRSSALVVGDFTGE